jgi:biopolymer transport protein TolR
MPKVQAIDNGSGGGGRRGRGRRISTTLAEINVVPLVDVMLVLLIIFMVTAPMMQRGLDVNLPAARRTQEIASDRVFVTVPLSFRQDRVVDLNEEPVSFDKLQERVRQLMVERPDKQVFLRSDAGLTVQELMDVMDRLKDAGVERVGIIAKKPGEQ